LEAAKTRAKEYLSELLILSPEGTAFLEAFCQKWYKPEFLFNGEDVLESKRNHPVAPWKLR